MIEALSAQSLEEALPLIRAYQAFYQVADIDDARNRDFFSPFIGTTQEGGVFVFRNAEGRLVGFATVYLTYASSIPARVGVMSDLYTMPAERGKGVGKQLIAHCLAFAKGCGAARLQWLTAEDNRPAQALYDSLPSRKSRWYVYTYTG